MKNLAIFIFVIFTGTQINGQEYKNPVISGFHPDPSICRVGDDFYLVNSSFEYFPGIPIFHSKDLISWEQIGNVLTRESQLPLSGYKCSDGIYAPTLRYHDGIFYMVTTNVNDGDYRNFYVTAAQPEGPWSDPVWVDQNGIDPSLFWDDDGKAYFLSNRGMTYKMGRGIYQSEIDIKTGKRLSGPTKIWDGTGGSYIEGPHMYKRNNLYYLLAAEGGTMYGHMVTIARSTNIWGPYESCPHNPILSNRYAYEPIYGTGHADMVELADGSWWMVFLAFRTPQVLGRETCLAPLNWTPDGWPVINKTGTISETICAKTLPLKPSEPKYSKDDFISDKFGFEWLFLRNPQMKNYSLKERKGFLRLKGSEISMFDQDSPTFLGRRQEHFNFQATTSLSFDPAKEKEEAGLIILMTNSSFYRLCIVKSGDKRVLQIRYNLHLLNKIVVEKELRDGPVYLRVSGDREFYHFLFSQDNKQFKELSKLNILFLSAEVTGGYNGVLIGMYATGNRAACTVPADFDWFEYRPLNE